MTPRRGTLLAAEVGKPHGIRGEVHVMRISDDPSRFEPGSMLERDDGRPLIVESARPHRDRFLVKFEGIDDRDAAETLRGPLFVDQSTARSLGEGEFWTRDVEGCAVVLAGGDPVGTVTRVVSGAAQDLLAVETAAGERLVPLVAAIVTDVDLGARRVTIDPPDGLLE